jgi:hypothetical protein
MRDVFLTFDVEGPPFNEDFVDGLILKSILRLLRLLEKYKLRGLFFITGSVAGKLATHKVSELLEKHEIGYHGLSHSTRPMIFEYTDVKDYEDALEISLKMETTGVNGKEKSSERPGIISLRSSFPNNKIESFRAPFLCWTPPHLEALRELGVRYDFSTCLSQYIGSTPAEFRGITFYPRPISFDSRIGTIGYVESFPKRQFLPKLLAREILSKDTTVLMKHPATLVYHTPSQVSIDNLDDTNRLQNQARGLFNGATLSFSTEFLFLELSLMKDSGIINVTPALKKANAHLNQTELDYKTIYEMSMWAPKSLFNVKPQFIPSHFSRFFSPTQDSKTQKLMPRREVQS